MTSVSLIAVISSLCGMLVQKLLTSKLNNRTPDGSSPSFKGLSNERSLLNNEWRGVPRVL